MIHTSITQNCTVFLLCRELTWSAILWSHHDVKGKPCNFEAYLCGSLYSTFKLSIQPFVFHNKRFRKLFKDQLDQSKATCSFNYRTSWATPTATATAISIISNTAVEDVNLWILFCYLISRAELPSPPSTPGARALARVSKALEIWFGVWLTPDCTDVSPFGTIYKTQVKEFQISIIDLQAGCIRTTVTSLGVSQHLQ